MQVCLTKKGLWGDVREGGDIHADSSIQGGADAEARSNALAQTLIIKVCVY